ncbi:HAD family hydrolase [Helcobacillus massiliensis]|uniref:HAD superfamily hydrolase (TIGR01509 family) n=1 Tax=Helcobacillus massiliensis TaxID=521392 RepID=A0A839QWN7_9MICO|nr:HAD family phosphatase [Helcobacillus massiliensis]MBB3023259.1 HAD superfamily hydrolase (TIGR01509 family) [Helcobacillus massiliensis]
MLPDFTPRALVFDCDGLLLDTESLWNRTQQAVLADYGTTLTDEQEAAIMGTTLHDTATIIAGAAGRSVEQVKSDVSEHFTRSLHGSIEVMPGARELLASLHGRIPMAVASNSSPDELQLKLEEGGLIGFFDSLHSAGSVERPKPAPDMYLAAARDLGVEPEHCLAFEDSPVGGRAAKAAGMRLVGIPSTALPVDVADVQVQSLCDPRLIEYLADRLGAVPSTAEETPDHD